jgi:hypothetical protein
MGDILRLCKKISANTAENNAAILRIDDSAVILGVSKMSSGNQEKQRLICQKIALDLDAGEG